MRIEVSGKYKQKHTIEVGDILYAYNHYHILIHDREHGYMWKSLSDPTMNANGWATTIEAARDYAQTRIRQWDGILYPQSQYKLVITPKEEKDGIASN